MTMIKIKKIAKFSIITFFISAAFFTPIAFAENNNSINATIDSFIQCNSKFFYELDKTKNEFQNIAPITSENNIAYFPVENTQQEQGHTLTFDKPIHYHGLTLSAYQDIFIPTAWLGKYYYWGFVIDNDVEEIKNTMSDISWQQYSPSSYIAYTQIYNVKKPDLGWQHNPYAIDGVVPKTHTVEKSLYLEAQPNGSALLLCSIQGDINDELLASLRPDIKIAEKVN